MIGPGPLLRHRTTLKLGGRALAEVVVEHERDLDALGEQLRRLGGEALVLGEGSNILAADRDLPVVLVRIALPDQPRIVHDTRDAAVVFASAGMRLPRLLGWLCSRGLSGLEALTGIPGSLGGAVAMNAGSYGVDMAQVLDRILVWTAAQGAIWREPGQWRAGYRFLDAKVEGRPVLMLGAELRLQRAPRNVVQAGMRRFYMQKKASQPVTMASAGCVFKNPASGQPAGRLLEQAGLRGRRLGNMIFSEHHANFLVNLGGGRSEHALELLDLARQRVADIFGLRLETEVKVVS